ncbi:hypothetical protein D9756_003089 [Leucocoprinus leucothites]|uniref:Zn(2)-C6 fungal-type domain-containing protein n=1 Tax=Leucocoprinus leucothites TaxID=201217 RepID=A0A8H5G784_9AGAR|nr:hypothetical protein D9756_003089 [Leucoagaricus leucothites]
MPPAPKSPQSAALPSAASKRSGAPKAKGAVRAKSGCYTCRIRRKKCDEQPNDQGHCSTCVRLRLECLGFGAKRPDWLRENRNVLQLRDKIKSFLASQGMIKGHSGSGARSSEQPTILRLTLNDDNSPYHSGSSSSPPSRSQTLSNEDYVPQPRHHHQTSNARGNWAPPAMEQSYRHSNGHYATHGSDYHRSTSPQSIDFPPTIPSPPPHSLVQPLRNTHRHNRHHPYRNGHYQRPNPVPVHHLPNWTPSKASGLSPSYNWGDNEMAGMMDMAFFTQDGQFNSAQTALSWSEPNDSAYVGATDAYGMLQGAQGTTQFIFDIPMNVNSPFRLHDVISFYQRYTTEVVTVQYLLGTKVIRDYIANTITSEELTSEQQAAALLSRVHFLRFSRPPEQLVLQSDTNVRLQLFEVENLLNQSASSPKSEDAMAALHLISVILFDGGYSGKWREYLTFAANYVKGKMRGMTKFNNGIEELRKLDDKDAFIVKTAIWFDVLASVTTNEPPFLMDIVRSLFKPNQSGLTELSNIAAAAAVLGGDYTRSLSNGSASPESSHAGLSGDDKTSMMSPMGCENRVLWALAEISSLATWKRQQKERGKLSVTDLVLQSKEIEKELEMKPTLVKIASDFPDFPNTISYSRYLASNIFRASALLYLHAVVNGGYPNVPQIHLAVEEVMRWIRRIPPKPSKPEDKEIHRTVIRSTVFAFYITGALTDNEKYRKTIRDYLMEEAGAVMGNCKVTMEILIQIWSERDRARGGHHHQCRDEVMWREKLMRRQPAESILLV